MPVGFLISMAASAPTSQGATPIEAKVAFSSTLAGGDIARVADSVGGTLVSVFFLIREVVVIRDEGPDGDNLLLFLPIV